MKNKRWSDHFWKAKQKTMGRKQTKKKKYEIILNGAIPKAFIMGRKTKDLSKYLVFKSAHVQYKAL